MRNFKNPIITESQLHNTSDPYVLLHNGIYYYCYDGVEGVYVAKADRIENLGKATPHLVYSYAQTGVTDDSWYAPEMYLIDNVWYIYAAPNIQNRHHAMSVLVNRNEDPTTPFQSLGLVQGINEGWSLDGTILCHEGARYMVWSGGDKLLIARMDSPWALSGEISVIGELEYEFEKRNGRIMEGPAVLKKDGMVYLVYSCNDSKTDDYAMGIMMLTGSDPTVKESWTKHPRPIFKKTNKIFGPGHCCFTQVLDGDEWKDYILYHANLTSGTGWGGRSTWAQEVYYDDAGFPIFGEPQF